MSDIREQIKDLRNTWPQIPDYTETMAEAADTMEKLLAVYEASEKYVDYYIEHDQNGVGSTETWILRCSIREAISKFDSDQTKGRSD
jgi:hypothetical protein